MNIGKSFTYMFEDENWVAKILVGGLFIIASFFLIGIPFVVGYMVETIKNVMEGVPSLPEWDNLGEKFTKGLLMALIIFIYNLPAILVSCVISTMTGALTGGNGDVAQGLASLLGLGQGCFNIIWWIVVTVLTPAAFIKYTLSGDFMAGFRFNELFEFITADLGSYIIVILLTWVAGIIAQFGLIGLCVGWFFTLFWAGLVAANLYGQLYVAQAGKAGEISEAEAAASDEG